MEIFILIYIVAFIYWSGFGVWDNIYNRYPPWIILVDMLVSLGAIAGMFVFYLQQSTPETALFWRVMLVVIVCWEVWLGRMDYLILKKNPTRELSVHENQWARKMGMMLFPLFYLPCLWMFYKIAFPY